MSRRVTLIVSGISTIGASIAALFLAKKTTDTVKKAVEGFNKEGEPVLPPGTGVPVPIRVTGYWPFTAREDEKKLEGGVRDRKSNPLHTLEDFQAGKAPFVSVSADHTIFPYGQRISIDQWPGVTFRIVDTGSHFFGAKKLIRIIGREPMDVCVDSSKTKVRPEAEATIYPGDHFEKKDKPIAYEKLGKPTVVGFSGFDLLGVEDA